MGLLLAEVVKAWVAKYDNMDSNLGEATFGK